ncbi:MAG: hypothetical protein ACOYIH_08855 [Candidatus Fimadaptatus sp.]|jgi:hypothetical protein
MKNLASKSISQLRKTAISLGAARSSVARMSKANLIETINRIYSDWRSKPENQALIKELDAYIAANFQPTK